MHPGTTTDAADSADNPASAVLSGGFASAAPRPGLTGRVSCRASNGGWGQTCCSQTRISRIAMIQIKACVGDLCDGDVRGARYEHL